MICRGQEASAGLAMHGMTVVDRALVVELAASARDAAAAGPVNPFAALQMQQMHQARRVPHMSGLVLQPQVEGF